MTIPPAVLKLIKVGEGEDVALAADEGNLGVRPASRSRKRYTFAELLDGSETLGDLNAQAAWVLDGDPAGREIG